MDGCDGCPDADLNALPQSLAFSAMTQQLCTIGYGSLRARKGKGLGGARSARISSYAASGSSILKLACAGMADE